MHDKISPRLVEDFAPSPTDVPSAYPGRWIVGDALMVGEILLDLRLVPGRRLPQARVTSWAPEVRGAYFPTGRSVPLRQALLQLNVARIEDRVPHIAVGSNANPVRLLDKLQSAHVSDIVPMTQAMVTGLSINFLSTLSDYGAYPTTPTMAGSGPKKTIDLSVAWLTEHQSEAVAASETGYLAARTALTGDLSATLRSGECVSDVVMYWGTYPVWVTTTTRRPLELVVSDETGLVVSGSQMSLQEFVESGQVAAGSPPDLPSREMQTWRMTPPYGQQGGEFPSIASGDHAPGPHAIHACVLPSANQRSRRGDSWAVINKDAAAELKQATEWVLVRRAGQRGPDGLPMSPSGLLARLRTSDEVPVGFVQLDQQIRDGLAVEIRERVSVEAVNHQRNWLGERLAPSPTYVICRVQFAELVGAERNVALVDEIALAIAGAESGDEIVIEGLVKETPQSDKPTIRQARCRAIPVDSSFQEARRSLAGGDSESRFPDAATALGVYPDLPWIYLDQDTRDDLCLGQEKLAVVRIRSSRRHLLAREVREIVLLLAVTVLGLMTITDSALLRIILITIVGVGAAFVILHRLRRRISPSSDG